MKKSKSGFTLLELLVVVGILAALVALALPFYQDYVNQSRLTAAEADLQTFKKALAMYDQLETKMFGGNGETTFLPLVGRYMQDYRSSSTQTNPVDPWGSDYKIDVKTGAIWSCGPNGADESVDSRLAVGDDVLTTWKPDFFVASAKRINSKTLEITFSRKVATLKAEKVTAETAGTSIRKISDSTYRIGFAADLPDTSGVRTVTVASTVDTTVAAQDGRTLDLAKAAGKKPDGAEVDSATY